MKRIEKEMMFNYSFGGKYNEKATIVNCIWELLDKVDEGGNYQITVDKIDKQFPLSKCKVTLDYIKEEKHEEK